VAKLDAKERKKLPKSEFALPKERKFPVENKSHARNAKARASEMEHKGKISKSTEEKIDAKADRKLGEKKKESHATVSAKRPHESVHVRPIANGFIVRKTENHPKTGYMETEHYTDEAPKVRVQK
jgi:hypothetical protein